MSLLPRRFWQIIIILSSLFLVPISSRFLVLAQEPSPFEINVIPQAEFATVGQSFTYTVVITNISQTPIQDVFIKVNTPQRATFLKTNYTNVNWGIRGGRRGETGEIFWFTQEPVIPGEAVAFNLIVNVLPKPDQELIFEGYGIAINKVDNVIVSGPPLKTKVLIPTPTATPPLPLTPSNTPIMTATPLHATLIAESTSNKVITSTPLVVATVPQTSQRNADSDIIASPIPTVSSQSTIRSAWSPGVSIAILGLLGLVMIIVGLTWFLRKR